MIISISLYTYDWPLHPFNQQHSITGTFGEFRVTHFHEGVDIDGDLNQSVYSIVSDIVLARGAQSVTIGNYRYIHIQPEVEVGDSVIAFQTVIGRIIEYQNTTHLHFEDGINDADKLNPLRPGALTPYEDTGFPSVWASPDFMLYRQGTNNQLPLNQPIWGLVDILVRARDRQSLGSENTGIYRIGYQITDLQNKVLLPYTEGIRFDDINGNVGLVYDIAR
ncbi:MAG: hypothetical protein QXM39_04940, partial [Thermoplasmata archaeon]